MQYPPIIDLHTHSTCSDGTYTPTELVELAKKIGLSALALTDHDTIDGLEEFQAAGKACGIETIPGIEFAAGLMGKMAERGRSLYLLGAKPGVADLAAERLQKQYPGLKIAGTHDGYFKEDAPVVDAIRESGADCVFVCLGAPKQELWMARFGPETGAHLMAGLGGVLDVFAGNVKRAPQAWQKLGLEWCYRLLHQPSRLGRMAKLPLFLVSAAREKGRREKA